MKKIMLAVLAPVLIMVPALVAGCASEATSTSTATAVTTVPPAGTAAATNLQIVSQQNPGISVNGQGIVNATPDTASLSLGVQTQAATVAEAQTTATAAMNAVISAVTGLGVASQDIQTGRYSISPVYSNVALPNNPNGTKITGYQVTNLVNVKVRDISSTGKIIDAAAAAGGDAIRINGVTFTVNDPTPLLQQARQLAVADAASKAKQLASLAGVTLGKPVSISENSGYSPTPVFSAAAPRAATPISPGTLQISLTVEIVYAIQ